MNTEEKIELTIFGEGPDEIEGAVIIDQFKTPSSESYLLEVGVFEDGAKMYIMAERFESTGWKWSNTFPEMDSMQLASYLEGCAELPDHRGWEDHDEYTAGLRRIAEKLRDIEMY